MINLSLGPGNPYDVEYEKEIDANVREVQDYVKSIKIINRTPGSGQCTYSLTLLDRSPSDEQELLVDFKKGLGYFVTNDGNKHFETFQALLSHYSPEYRRRFVENISKGLSMSNRTGF